VSVSTADNTLATVNNTVVVKIVNTALSMGAALLVRLVKVALTMGAALIARTAVLLVRLVNVALTVSAALIMEIVIAVRGFVEKTEIVVFVLVSVGVTLTMSAALLMRLRLVRLVNVALTVFAALLVGVFGAEISDTAVGGAAVESVVATIELRESSLSVEKTISAAVFETCNIVHNALVNAVIKGSGIDAVSLKANIINFLVEIILF